MRVKMITIDLTHPDYKKAFADCEVGETKTITMTVTEKTDDQIVAELDLESYDEGEHAEEESGEEAEYSEKPSGKMPRGLAIVIGKMK